MKPSLVRRNILIFRHFCRKAAATISCPTSPAHKIEVNPSTNDSSSKYGEVT